MPYAIPPEQRRLLVERYQTPSPSGPAGAHVASPAVTTAQPSGPADAEMPRPQIRTLEPSGPALTPQQLADLPSRQNPEYVDWQKQIAAAKEEDEYLKQVRWERQREEAKQRGELVPVVSSMDGEYPYAVAEDAQGRHFLVPGYGPGEGEFIELPRNYSSDDLGEALMFAAGIPEATRGAMAAQADTGGKR